MVHTLGQNRAEGDGRQSPWLLPNSPDLQEGSECCSGKKERHLNKDRVFRGMDEQSRLWPLPLTVPRNKEYVSKSEAEGILSRWSPGQFLGWAAKDQQLFKDLCLSHSGYENHSRNHRDL